MMYKNVLIPTFIDNEERLKTAVSAARFLLSEGGKITLLNVIEEIPLYVESYIPTEVLASSVEEVSEALNTVAATIGPDIQTKAVKGHAGRTIISEAEATKADLIIISSHRPGLAD